MIIHKHMNLAISSCLRSFPRENFFISAELHFSNLINDYITHMTIDNEIRRSWEIAGFTNESLIFPAPPTAPNAQESVLPDPFLAPAGTDKAAAANAAAEDEAIKTPECKVNKVRIRIRIKVRAMVRYRHDPDQMWV